MLFGRQIKSLFKGMKKILLTLLWGTCFFVVQAQEELLKLQAETRIDYQREYVDGRSIHSNSGFKGKYLNVIISRTSHADCMCRPTAKFSRWAAMSSSARSRATKTQPAPSML